MSILNNSLLLGAPAGGAAGYQISRSLRFNSSDSAYLSRTPASAGNRKTWTWAGWVKRSELGTNQALFSAPQGGGYPNTGIIFNSSNQLRFFASDASTNVFAERVTSAVYRDTSAWMHIVVAVDYANTQAKIYVNGSEVTAFTTSTGPTNTDGLINSSGTVHVIGQFTNVWYLNAYLADIHFIDGQALDPTSFTEFDDNGVLQPIAYAGSYGTNGFRLDFSDNSAATATTLGKDRAGSNNWTPNNLSVAAGAGNDSLVDSPTNYGTDTGAGGEVRGNYATLNPLSIGDGTLSNGNLDLVTSTGGYSSKLSTIGMSSGKWYFEATQTAASANQAVVGLVRYDFISSNDIGGTAGTSWGYYGRDGRKYTGFIDLAYGATYGNNDCIGAAFDADNGTLTFYKNGISQGQAYSGLTSGPYFFAVGDSQSSATVSFSTNFGQRPFAYTAPSGFKALCTTNLPEPTIADGSTVFDAVLYTANVSGGKTISMPGGFSPDLVWIKNRDNVEQHYLADTVRGDGSNKYLRSNSTNAEGGVIAGDCSITFGSSGFTLTDPNFTAGEIYFQNRTYAAWCWDAGSSTVTNTQGSITSQVRANASAGFSVVTYTGNAVQGATVGHGLGVAPSMVIYKSRDGSLDWLVYHSALGATKGMYLNQTLAAITSANFFNNTAPNSTTLYLNSSPPAGQTNANGNRYVAYCFAPVDGYSSFGSYTGNGSADGPFVFCNFRPRWLLIKASSTSSTWTLLDVARSTYNAADARLFADTSEAETSNGNGATDFLSNGFKLRVGHVGINTSGATYIYAAFAESPFAYARAR